jgi:hypothetical protein
MGTFQRGSDGRTAWSEDPIGGLRILKGRSGRTQSLWRRAFSGPWPLRAWRGDRRACGSCPSREPSREVFQGKLWSSGHVGAWRYMGSACGTRERWKTSRGPSAPSTRSLGGDGCGSGRDALLTRTRKDFVW